MTHAISGRMVSLSNGESGDRTKLGQGFKINLLAMCAGISENPVDCVGSAHDWVVFTCCSLQACQSRSLEALGQNPGSFRKMMKNGVVTL